MQTNVAIVEDSAGICEELKHILEKAPDMTCVSISRNAETALQRLPSTKPDVIIMDINLPGGISGIQCTLRLKRLLPQSEFVMFTINEDTDQIMQAFEAGASGYLLKNTPPAELLSAIREVRNYGAPMSREVARKMIQTFRRPAQPAAPGEVLTPREEEILQLLSQGLLYKEIGDRLNIKLDTVGTHLKSIYRKLHVHSRTEAVMKSIPRFSDFTK